MGNVRGDHLWEAMLSGFVQRNSLVTIYGRCFWSGPTLLRLLFLGKPGVWWTVMGRRRTRSTYGHQAQGDHLWETVKVTSYGTLGERGCFPSNWVEAARGSMGDHLWEMQGKCDLGLGWSISSRVASIGAFDAIWTLQGDHLWDAFRRNVTSRPCARAKSGGEVTTYGTHDGLF